MALSGHHPDKEINELGARGIGEIGLASKLDKAHEKAVQSKARDAGSQKAALSLRKDLEGARQSSRRAEADAAALKKQVADLKSELDRLNTNRDLLQAELNVALSEVTQLRTRLRITAESQRVGLRLRLKAVQCDLDVSRQATVQAQRQAIELGEQAIQLQSELKLGKAERDELRAELNQAQVSLEAKSPLSKRRYTHLSASSEVDLRSM